MDITDVIPKWLLPSKEVPDEPWARGVLREADTRLARHVARHIMTIGKWAMDRDLQLQPIRFGQEGLRIPVVNVLNMILEGVGVWHRDRILVQTMEEFLASSADLEGYLHNLQAAKRQLEGHMTRCVCAIPCPSRPPGKPPVVSRIKEIDDLFTELDADLEPIPLCMTFMAGREGHKMMNLNLPTMRDRLVSTFAKALKH